MNRIPVFLQVFVCAALGTVAGFSLGQHEWLRLPDGIVLTLAAPFIYINEPKFYALLTMSIFSALPKIILFGALIGALTTRVKYPRVLVYSVFVWPIVAIWARLYTALITARGAEISGGTLVAEAAWMDFSSLTLFYISVIVLFLVVTYLSHTIAKRMRHLQAPITTRS